MLLSMSSLGIQTCSGIGNQSLFPANTSEIKIFPKNPSICSFRKKQNLKPLGIWASSPVTQETADGQKKKMKVVVKAMERPRLLLKFIWMEKNIGIAIDQLIPGGHGTIPVSPYYFWPRKDAWEELKVVLESKPWISDKQMVLLLNQATDIINLWQQSGGA